MATIRKDVWQQEQDDIVLGCVLDSIENKYSKLKAFQVASEKMAMLDIIRTPAAINYRWNTVIARTENTKELIEVAAQMRLEKLKEEEPITTIEPASIPVVDEKPQESPLADLNSLVHGVERYQKRIKELELTVRELGFRIKELESIETDYKEMCAIMVKARKLMLDDEPVKRSTFQIDQSGNIGLK